MAEEEGNPCDVDDVVCEMEVLAHLRGIAEWAWHEQLRGSVESI